MRWLVLVLLGCASPPSLTGTWDGTVDCGVSLDATIDLADTEDEGEAEGDGTISFRDADGNDVVLAFHAAAEFDPKDPTPVDVDVVITDCAMGEDEFLCWAARDVAWDLEDDEIGGRFEGFPVNDGSCPFQVERVE